MAERLSGLVGYAIGRETYKNWEHGTTIPQDIVDAATRIGAEVGLPRIAVPRLNIPIPFIGAIGACSEVDWTDIFASDDLEFVPPEMGDPKGRYACKVQGDSMYDLLWPEDICVFHASDVPKLGCVCMYRSNKNQVTIKLLKHDGEQFILHPINPSYEDTPVPPDGVVLGYLVGIVRTEGLRKTTLYDPSGIRSK